MTGPIQTENEITRRLLPLFQEFHNAARKQIDDMPILETQKLAAFNGFIQNMARLYGAVFDDLTTAWREGHSDTDFPPACTKAEIQ